MIQLYLDCKELGGGFPAEQLFPYSDINVKYSINRIIIRLGREWEKEQYDKREAEREQQKAHQEAQASIQKGMQMGRRKWGR